MKTELWAVATQFAGQSYYCFTGVWDTQAEAEEAKIAEEQKIAAKIARGYPGNSVSVRRYDPYDYVPCQLGQVRANPEDIILSHQRESGWHARVLVQPPPPPKRKRKKKAESRGYYDDDGGFLAVARPSKSSLAALSPAVRRKVWATMKDMHEDTQFVAEAKILTNRMTGDDHRTLNDAIEVIGYLKEPNNYSRLYVSPDGRTFSGDQKLKDAGTHRHAQRRQ